MHSELLKKFAAELKSSREEKQITIAQIAAKTRIDAKYLSAIENANFEVLPELYIRAFIKEFAQSVDLNPEETIKKFDLAKAGRSENAEEAEKEGTPVIEKARRVTKSFKRQFESEDVEPYAPAEEVKKSIDPRLFYAIIGIAAIILIAGVFLIFSSSTKLEKDTNYSSQQESGDVEKRYEEPAKQQQTAAPADSLQLKVIANDLVWFQVASDDSQPKQFLFKDQQSVVLTAKDKFIMNIGNAGGVTLILNGKTLDPVGKSGDVRNVQIDKEGIKLLTLERPKDERAPAK